MTAFTLDPVHARPAPATGGGTTQGTILWLLVAGTGSGWISPPDTSSLAASAGTDVGAVFVLATVIATFVLLRQPLAAGLHVLARSRPLALLAAFACASVAWAEVPVQTAQGILRLGVGVLVGGGLARRLSPDALLRSLYLATAGSSTISVLLEATSPERVRLANGVWYGLYGWNSTAGLVASIGVLLALTLPRPAAGPRVLRILLLVGSAATLVLSASRTAQLAALGGLGAVLAGRMYRKDPKVGIAAAIVAGVGIGVATTSEQATLLDLAGKDPSLSDRLNIWPRVVSEILARPLTGWGWRSYWFSERAASEFSAFFRIPAHSHNQLLEVALQLGLFGAATFVWLVVSTGRGLVSYLVHERQTNYAPSTIALFGLLLTMTGSNAFLLQNSIFSVIFVVLIAIALSQPRLDQSFFKPHLKPNGQTID